MKKRIRFLIGFIILSAVLALLKHYFDRQFTFIGSPWAEHRPVWVNTIDALNQPVSADMHGRITVALYNGGYLYDESTGAGIDKDIVDELSKRMGITFDIKVVPRARTYTMLKEGLMPMSVSSVATPERVQHSYFIPYFSQKNYLLSKKDLGNLTEGELLKRTDIRVGIVRGYYYGEYYSGLVQKLREKRMLVEARDTVQMYETLKSGWTQVVINIPSSYLFYLKFMNIQDMSVNDWAPDEEPLKRCLALSKLYFTQEDAKAFEAVIDAMRQDGTLYKIYRKYLPEGEAKRMSDF